MTKRQASPAADPIPTRVEISAGGHQVTIESPDSLNTVARKALELWKATDSPAIVRGMSTSVGFSMDPVDSPVPPELTLPDRLTGDDADDDRHTRPEHRP